MSPLILKRASASRSSGQWGDDDYDVLDDPQHFTSCFLVFTQHMRVVSQKGDGRTMRACADPVRAEVIANPILRDAFLNVAQRYRHLAEQIVHASERRYRMP
jgi:hypothetical protein